MGVLAERAIASRALFETMLKPDLRQWLDSAAATARDSDGDIVSLTFGADEPAAVLATESAPHRHPVVMCTLHDGHIVVWVLGPSLAEEVPHDAAGVPVDDTMTVGDVVDHLVALTRRSEGAQLVLEFAGDRRTATLAPA